MYSKTTFIILPIACLAWLTALPAQPKLTLEQAIRQAMGNNKELAIAKLEVERAKTRLLWSGRLPNPEMEVSGLVDTFGNGEGEHNFGVAFSQRYPHTSKLQAEKDLRLSQVFLAEAEVEEQARNLAENVARTIVALAASEKYIAHGKEHADLLSVIAKTLESQVGRGEASHLDLAQAVLELRHSQQKARSFQTDRNQNRFKLQQLLGIPTTVDIEVDYSLGLQEDPPPQPIADEAILRQRPDHAMAAHSVKTAGHSLALEKAKQRQDRTYSVFLEQERSMDEPAGMDNNTFLGFGVSIPLPVREKNQEGIALAENGLDEAALNEKASRFNILSEYKAAWQLHQDNWETARAASGDILNAARKNYDATRLAYLDGQVSLIQVQRAQEQLLELEQDSLQAIVRFHQSYVQLQKTSGQILPSNLK
jgi:cobalt-zinc-cadmium efflux system outer membrane protein